tara:strand:+ start:2828 stop:6079 length:3252 start_codon:yes stop_codon:yes gene_type:complete
MKKILISFLALTFASHALQAQKKEDNYFLKSSQLNALKFRNIGPAITSGRVADIAVNPNNHDEWYVATASGGVWKTTNHGVTFSPIFDGEGSYSIGCVTIDPNNEHVIWVGSGENNNQRSVSYGDGIYKSTDGGKSWKNKGLKASEHIGMIKVDPRNSNVIYVAVYGPLWSAGGDRGLYKSVDGGETWSLILEVDEHTGINEVHFDPNNPDVIYATAHQRRRHVYTYVSGGEGSTIYKSVDAGAHFKKIENGLPKGKMGRIGMAVSLVNSDVLYAIVEAESGKGGFFRSTDRGASWNKTDDYVTSGNYYQELFCDPVDVDKVYAMDTYCRITKDGGKSFQRLGESNKHVDNHAIWIDPNNTEHLIMGCDGGIYETYDAAVNWRFFANLPVTQFYKVAVDNAEPFYNVYGGTQDNFSLGGPSRTLKNSGIDNYDWFVTNNGDGFESAIDPEDPNIVYAQAQYGWLVRYDKKSGQKLGIQPQPPVGEAYRWNWDAPLFVSPHDAKTLYFAANKVFRSTNRGTAWEVISPDLTAKRDRNKLKVMGKVQSIDAVMKNKSTSIYGNIVALSESPITKGLLYAGTDDGLIQVTENGGGKWRKIASFPTVPEYTYVNAVLASQHDEATVYAVFNNHKNGDFKPYILKSSDKGKSWTSITNNLPERGSVYCIAEDHVDKNILFTGTEFGVFVTLNGGQNWVQLKGGLPTIAIRDMAIQKEKNDLVLASFGRGFYVLDDYSPLRSMTTESLKEPFHLYNSRPGLVFTENHKYGYDGIGFQGASFYVAENPENGVAFTYSLKDGEKTLKEKRQEKEQKQAKDGEEVVYPTKKEIKAEEIEEKPYLIFSISDESGYELRRFTSTPSSGIKRVNWDGKLASIADVNTGGEPLTNSNASYYAMPGTYYLSVLKVVNGQLNDTLATRLPFELKTLNESVLPENQVEKLAFQRDLETFRREANGINRYFQHLKSNVQKLKAVVRNTPNIDLTVLNQLRTLELKLLELDETLHGDHSLSKHEFETTPGIMSRVGLTVWNSYGNQQEVTEIQRKDLEVARKEMVAVKQKLEKAKAEVQQLEEQLIKAGIPYPSDVLPQMD